MQDGINQRIKKIIKYSGKTTNAFSIEIGVSQPTMKACVDGSNNPSFETIQKIIKGYPIISLDWLITGSGDMLKTDSSLNPATSIHGNVKGSVVGGGVLNNGNINGNGNNVGMIPADCERELMKARAEIEFLKKTLKEKESQSKIKVENMLKQHNQEKESLKNQLEQAIEERNRSLVDKDRAIAMLEKALSR